LAQTMGYSRPAVLTDTSVTPMRENLSCVSGGPTIGGVLSADPAVGRDVEWKFPLAQDGETTSRFIASQYGLLTNSLAAATTLNMRIVRVLVEPGASITMLPAAFAASFYRFWRGKTRVRMTWFSSPLVRGRVKLFIINSFEFPNSGSFPDNTARVIYVDVIGTTTIEFDIEWQHLTEFLPVSWGAITTPLAGNDDPFIRWNWEDGPNGPSESPVSITAMVEVMVPDFEGEVMELNTPYNASLVKFFPQGKLTGEIDDDLLLHTRRLQLVLNMNTALGTGAGQSTTPYYVTLPSFGWYPKLGTFGAASSQFSTFAIGIGADMWLASAFANCVGGCVHNFRPQNPVSTDQFYLYESNRLGAIGCTTSSFRTDSFDFPSLSGVYYTTTNDSHSITIPDRTPYPMRSQRISYLTQTALVCDSSFTFYDLGSALGSATSRSFYVFRAGAEDFRVGGWLGPPLLTVGN